MSEVARTSGGWMYALDERTLEHLDEEGWSTPKTVASDYRLEGLNADPLTVERRLDLLIERELVAPVASGYEITRWGVAYLRGDFDARFAYDPNARSW